MLAHGGREAMVMAPPTSAWLSSIALLQWLPSFPPQEFPTPVSSLTSLQSLPSQQQPSPWDYSTIPKFQFPATVPSRVCMAAARTVWFSFLLGCHRSAVSLSALNVSPLTQTIAPMWGLPLCFSSSTCQGQVQSSSTLIFFPLVPSSYRVLRGSIYSFLLVRYSCLLSAGVSWHIHGERYIPCPPTPLPSCPSLDTLLKDLLKRHEVAPSTWFLPSLDTRQA